MTDNQIKEAISETFVRLILAHDGFKIFKAEYDHGIDLTVVPTEVEILPSKEKMINDLGMPVHIQLKCTTEKEVVFGTKNIEYNLRMKNYRQLKKSVDLPYSAMILIVFILPNEKSQWMKVVKKQMLLRKHCFWYVPSDSKISATDNSKLKGSKIKILIPRKNHFLNDFKEIYNSVHK